MRAHRPLRSGWGTSGESNGKLHGHRVYVQVYRFLGRVGRKPQTVSR